MKSWMQWMLRPGAGAPRATFWIRLMAGCARALVARRFPPFLRRAVAAEGDPSPGEGGTCVRPSPRLNGRAVTGRRVVAATQAARSAVSTSSGW